MIGIDRARRVRSGTSLEIVSDTKGANPCGFYSVFCVIWVVLGNFRGVRAGVRKTFMIGIDRARRVRSGTSLGIVLDTKEANPFVFFNNFRVFSVFFCSFFDFRRVMGGYFWKFFFWNR